MRDCPHEMREEFLEHVDVEGVDHDDDACGRALTQDDGESLDNAGAGVAGVS